MHHLQIRSGALMNLPGLHQLVPSSELKMTAFYLFFLGLTLTPVLVDNITALESFFNISEAGNDTINDPVDTSDAPVTTSNFITNMSESLETNDSRSGYDNTTASTQTPQNSSEFGKTSMGGDSIFRTTAFTKLSPTPPPYSQKPGEKMETTTTWTTRNANSSASNSPGILILVIILIIIFGFVFACLVSWNRGRRYSVDLASRPAENVPLSTVEPALHFDSEPQNDLKTFESTESEPRATGVATETTGEKKEEAAIAAASTETAAPLEAPPAAPPPDSSIEKADDTEETSPAPPEHPAEEKTDDEGVSSNKTSVESLKETNENNSNNSGFSWRRDRQRSKRIWDVRFDCSV